MSYLLEELQVYSHLNKTLHGAGAVCHEALLTEGDRLSLESRKLRLLSLHTHTQKKKLFTSDDYKGEYFMCSELCCIKHSIVIKNKLEK